MAGGASRGRPRPGAPAGRGRASGKPAGAPSGSKRPKQPPQPQPTPPDLTPFTLGAVPGATPGRWIDAWNDRMPQPLILQEITVAHQRDALTTGEVDAALVRLPIDRDDLHVIALYDEVPVVVASVDSHLTAADELTVADLAGEVLIVPADDVLHVRAPGTTPPRFAPPIDTAEAIATVAAGVGIVIVPMSLARLHHRKDVDYRPVTDLPTSRIALAWIADRTTPAVEAFVGIVRGRTANSSR